MLYPTRFIRSALRVLSFALLFAAGSLVPVAADAGFMPNFTGFTQMSDAASATDVVNFAVYQNAGNWATALGVAPTPGADVNAAYVYFYEVVNNGGAASKIGDFNVNSTDQPYTSSGWLAGTVFSDGDGAVGPPANQYLGPNPPGMPPDDPSNSAPSVSGLAAPVFAPSGAAVNPLASNTGGLANGDNASFLFFTPPTFAQSLTSGLFSSVLFLTSNSVPTYSAGQVLNVSTGNSSDGGIPTQAPEPTTLAIWGLGMLGLVYVGRQRWKNSRLCAVRV